MSFEDNILTDVPPCLLQLPHLRVLYLSKNRLTNLPDLLEWSESLENLDISYNKITSIQGTPLAKSISTLNLAYNCFDSIPECISNFLSLESLDLSYNSNITHLPLEMGQLTRLHTLKLAGLTKLVDPPPKIHKNLTSCTEQDPPDGLNTSTAECMEYLYNKLYHLKPSYGMKIMVLGTSGSGRSTFVACLQGKSLNSGPTVDLAISEWKHRPNLLKKQFRFTVWDFGGQDQLYPCFLTPACICILLFNFNDDPAVTLPEIEGFLYAISNRSSGSLVFIVGTHLKDVQNESQTRTDSFLNTIAEVAQKYSGKLQVEIICSVELEDMKGFKNKIYESAENFMFEGKRVMGQLVPSKYHELQNTLLTRQKGLNCAPVIHISEFKALVRNMSHPDSDDELEKLTTFLVNTGTILHYDDQSHDLHDLYFTDPSWLCSIMTKLFHTNGASSCIKEGILLMGSKEELVAGEKFPMQYINQYLTLLDRFGIALVLDRQRILIPSMLPDNRPDSIDMKQLTDQHVYIRCMAFDTFIVQDVFSRFISQIIHTLPKLQSLFKTINQDKIDAFKCTDSLIHEALFSIQSPHHLMDVTQVRMEYWKTGMFYQDPQVTFLVESMAKSNVCEGEGILLLASANAVGKSVFCEMVDMSQSLFDEIYHGKFKDMIPCPICLNDNVPHPHTFTYKECFKLVMQNTHSIQCSMRHTSEMADIAPDILLLDISPDLRAEHSTIKISTSEGSVLGKGAFGTVYRGLLRGKSVAVKKFKQCSTMDRDAFSELRKEASLHQKLRHPCLVGLVGVCLHPELELVLEHAPLGSLGSFLHKSPPVPLSRIVVYRIAAQVAAALGALHNKGVIYRDLKSANVLLWSVDPESLCHCKLCDFGTATYQSAIGLESSVHGTKGFIAPEVLRLGKGRSRFIYNQKADVYSFGMLLYEIMYQKNPFHDMDSVRIDSAVLRGMRPQLYDTPSASSYFYLTRLMQECWHVNPQKRPSTDDIIKKVSMCYFQSTMSITELDTPSLIYQACVIQDENNPQIWVCCITSEGKTEVIPYSLITMKQAGQLYTSSNIVQGIGQCGDFVWMGSSDKSQPGVIQIINSTCNKPLRTIPVGRNITCIACCGKWVCCGSADGYLLAFHSDIAQLAAQPVASKKITSCTIESLVVALDCIWISFGHSIQILDCETFSNLSVITDEEDDRGVVGQMMLSTDKGIIWSSNIPHSSFLNAWSASEKRKLFEVNCVQYSMVICPNMEDPDRQMVITALAPVLDTVWVCTQSGYILVLHEKELLMWFEVCEQDVFFMECIPHPGPCQTEKAMVISAGSDKTKVVPAHTLILYEAFPSNMCRQIKLVQDKSSSYLKNHYSVTEMIEEGNFLDGTEISFQYNTNQMEFGNIFDSYLSHLRH